MAIEDKLREHLDELIRDGRHLSWGNAEHGVCLDQNQVAQCRAWLGAAESALSLVCPTPNDAYRRAGASIVAKAEGADLAVNDDVNAYTELLMRLVADVDEGLLTSVADQASAEAFDDLLDHAKAYLDEGRKDGSGVLSTAVFEDTLRRIGRSHGIEDRQLDTVISELQKLDVLTRIDAKACRLAAGIRNEALHANWDEFELSDVKRTIEITRELLNTHLAR